MGWRELVNRRYKGVVVVSALLAIVVAGWTMVGHFSEAGSVTYVSVAFYTTDDGQTFFRDDFERIPPYDKSGKQAVRAVVFEANGKPFVGYMSRFSQSAKAAIEKYNADMATGKYTSGPPASFAAYQIATMSGAEYKRPGDKSWERNPSWLPRLGTMKASDGSEANMVFP
jgi:hypothetical protein